MRDMNGLIFNRMLSRGQGNQQDQNGADYYSASMLVRFFIFITISITIIRL
jgi:hypothetical protein